MSRLVILTLMMMCIDSQASGQTPENFRRENLVAWCIVPFDARQRSPEARAKMLIELGMRRCAYDWRAPHVDQFEDEIVQYAKHGIEYVAFWDEHEVAFELFEKHQLRPQVWKTLTPNPPGDTQAETVAGAVKSSLPLAKRTKQLGFPLGLYNHGGWGGEPANLVAVCRALHEREYNHVGIVYNFHHGHGHIHDFERVLNLMAPYLMCVNLNGMVDLQDERYAATPQKYKILPIGSGDFEDEMIRALIESGYDGSIGVLGHVAELDVAEVLQQNLAGLQEILDR